MLAQKLIFSYYSRIIVQFVQIFASIIVARIAGPAVLGTVSFGLAYVTMFISIADLGFGTAHMKLVSGGEDISRCLGTFIPIKILLIIAYIFTVTAFFVVQKYIFNVSFESNDHILVIFILLGAMSIHEFFVIPKTTYSAFTQVAKTNLPELLSIFLYQIIRIVVVIIGFKAVAMAIGKIAAVLIIVPIYWYMFREFEIGKFDKKLAKRYLALAMPMLLMGVATKLTATIDKVLLQFFTNSETLGYYSAAFRFGSFILLIGHSLNNLFFPTFSKAFSENNLNLIKRSLLKYERFTFIYIMPFVILITMNTDIIIKLLLGTEFTPSISIMKFINLAMFLMVASIPFGAVITGKGLFKKAAMINILNFGIYFCCLIIFIHPKLLNSSGIGAAIALVISYFFLGLSYRYNAYKLIKDVKLKMTAKYIIVGITTYILFSFLLHIKIIEGSVNFRLIHAIFFVIIFYSIMCLLGLFKSYDLYYAKTLLDIRKVGKYVKGEMKNKD